MVLQKPSCGSQPWAAPGTQEPISFAPPLYSWSLSAFCFPFPLLHWCTQEDVFKRANCSLPVCRAGRGFSQDRILPHPCLSRQFPLYSRNCETAVPCSAVESLVRLCTTQAAEPRGSSGCWLEPGTLGVTPEHHRSLPASLAAAVVSALRCRCLLILKHDFCILLLAAGQ